MRHPNTQVQDRMKKYLKISVYLSNHKRKDLKKELTAKNDQTLALKSVYLLMKNFWSQKGVFHLCNLCMFQTRV